MAQDRNGKTIQAGDILVVQAQVAELRVEDGKDVVILQDLASEMRFHLPTGSTEKLSDLLNDQTSEIEQRLRAQTEEYGRVLRQLNGDLQAMTQQRDRLAQELQEKQPLSVAAEDQPQTPSPTVEGQALPGENQAQ